MHLRRSSHLIVLVDVVVLMVLVALAVLYALAVLVAVAALVVLIALVALLAPLDLVAPFALVVLAALAVLAVLVLHLYPFHHLIAAELHLRTSSHDVTRATLFVSQISQRLWATAPPSLQISERHGPQDRVEVDRRFSCSGQESRVLAFVDRRPICTCQDYVCPVVGPNRQSAEAFRRRLRGAMN